MEKEWEMDEKRRKEIEEEEKLREAIRNNNSFDKNYRNIIIVISLLAIPHIPILFIKKNARFSSFDETLSVYSIMSSTKSQFDKTMKNWGLLD
jgi:hypothetical protein